MRTLAMGRSHGRCSSAPRSCAVVIVKSAPSSTRPKRVSLYRRGLNRVKVAQRRKRGVHVALKSLECGVTSMTYLHQILLSSACIVNAICTPGAFDHAGKAQVLAKSNAYPACYACLKKAPGDTKSEAGSTCHRVGHELFQLTPLRNFQNWTCNLCAGSGTSI